MGPASQVLERVFANPLVVKAARARLRWRHVLSWGVIVLTVTGFLTVIIYTSQVERGLATPAQAARWTLLPVIIIQAVLLMLLGTGAVAAGVAQERDEGLLDYQRMTPMSPGAKLLGYLFGLPIREYFLFALTLPFLAFGVIKGEFPLTTVAHFYLIFFSSVLVYHMTGMAAGIASSKPRLAGFMAQGMVVLLYFVLPNLSHLGLTFFEFLTIRPALFGLITQEIDRLGVGAQLVVENHFTALDSFRDIPLFDFSVHPSLYTMLVQGAMLATLWTIVYRKWRDDAALPFSKAFGLAFFVGTSLFLVGSVWPILTNDDVFSGFIRHFAGREWEADGFTLSPGEMVVFTTMLLVIPAAALCGVALFTLLCTTPTRHRMTSSLRRVVRHGGRRVPLRWDGGSSLPLAAGCVLVMGLALGVLTRVALNHARFEQVPPILALAAPWLYVSLIVLALQGALERFGMRAFFVATFILWMVPFFTAVLFGATFESEPGAGIVSLPFPPAGLFFAGLEMVKIAAPSVALSDGGPEWIVAHAGHLTIGAIAFYGVLAGVTLQASGRQRRRIRHAVLSDAEASGRA